RAGRVSPRDRGSRARPERRRLSRRAPSGEEYARGMGKVYEAIDEKLAAWIEQQHVFFVGTAPLAEDGHVNVSPKGDLRWFRILGPSQVGYLDFVGSGAETIAQARENGPIVVMFCAFDGPPRIVRLHGRASVLPPTDELAAHFDPPEHAVRSVIRVEVERIADSCGLRRAADALRGHAHPAGGMAGHDGA